MMDDREVGRSELATGHITVLSGKREGELQVTPESGGFPEPAQQQASMGGYRSTGSNYMLVTF